MILRDDSILARILSRITEGKIAIWLWRHPGWHDVQEITEAHPLLSEKRIYQVLKDMRSLNFIEVRKIGRKYEYKLSPLLFDELNKGIGSH